MKKNLLMLGLLPVLALMAGDTLANDYSPPKIVEEDYEDLLREYKLIKAKKSKLSRSGRDYIEWRVKRLVNEGKIIIED